MHGITTKVQQLLQSRQFYWGVIIFLGIEALWIAVSAVYPMAFDEEFHLGVIRIYSHQWLPFLAGQPDGANMYGALAVDPSYIYHYLMSFPYRIIAALTDSLTAQVVLLRLINSAMMIGGVVLFGRVLRRAGLAPAFISTITLLFALVPAVVLLAGQINYDNLLFLLVAWVCWLVLGLTKDIQRRTIRLESFGLLAIVLLLASLVKYAFLAIALAVAIYVGALLAWYFRGQGAKFWTAVALGYKRLSGLAKVSLLIGFILSSGLFAQRYVANVLRHGNPLPSCEVVLDIEDCMEYSPWARNYRLAADGPAIDKNPLTYTWQWAQSLHYRLFFMITGPPNYTNYPPPVLPSAATIIIGIFGWLAAVFYARKVFGHRPFLLFVVLMSAIYGLILWLQNYAQFVETGEPVAINGRYLIPLLFPLATILASGLSIALKRWPVVKTWAATMAILLFLQGGGVFGFILRSDASWYWPNVLVQHTNQLAQQVLTPIMFIGPKDY